MRNFLTVLMAGLLAGCAVVPIEVPNQPGQVKINPTPNAKLGHLYFSGPGGRQVGFQTDDGTVWYELCYDDYKIDALKDLSQYISVDSVTMTKATGTLDAKAMAGMPVFGITANVTANAKRLYTIENLRLLSISDAGVAHVRASIGDGCRITIDEYLARPDMKVVLLTSAQRADKVSDVTTAGAGIGLGGGTTSVSSGGSSATVALAGAGIGVGGSNTADAQFEMVFFTGLLAPESKP